MKHQVFDWLKNLMDRLISTFPSVLGQIFCLSLTSSYIHDKKHSLRKTPELDEHAVIYKNL